jgi:hypothetical protein
MMLNVVYVGLLVHIFVSFYFLADAAAAIKDNTKDVALQVQYPLVLPIVSAVVLIVLAFITGQIVMAKKK